MKRQSFLTTGMPLLMLLLLALLGVPRVIAHDLQLVDPGGWINRLLVFIPPLIWLIVVLRSKTTKPFAALLFIGILYGILLAVTHQLLWNYAFDQPPQLGGNLRHLSPAVGSLIARIFAFISSLATGTVVGILLGALGAAVKKLTYKRH
ncbi:hypothetical protein EBB07_08905 [Paenibacillaceae bacterium]|nr:hypothetical protein EBB07_08905 [Paenibacillaceae bacterium]